MWCAKGRQAHCTYLYKAFTKYYSKWVILFEQQNILILNRFCTLCNFKNSCAHINQYGHHILSNGESDT